MKKDKIVYSPKIAVTVTEQQKAEAYVRSQIPELMELSFGCEVKRFEHTPREYFIDYHGDKALIYREDSSTFSEKGEMTIVGHPIQLQHWLRVLEIYSEKWMYTMCFEHGELLLGSGTIRFNLTTGQPASEADYKTFNQIVGV